MLSAQAPSQSSLGCAFPRANSCRIILVDEALIRAVGLDGRANAASRAGTLQRLAAVSSWQEAIPTKRRETAAMTETTEKKPFICSICGGNIDVQPGGWDASAASGAVQRAPADGWVLPLDGLSLSGDIPNP